MVYQSFWFITNLIIFICPEIDFKLRSNPVRLPKRWDYRHEPQSSVLLQYFPCKSDPWILPTPWNSSYWNTVEEWSHVRRIQVFLSKQEYCNLSTLLQRHGTVLGMHFRAPPPPPWQGTGVYSDYSSQLAIVCLYASMEKHFCHVPLCAVCRYDWILM